MKTRLTGSFLAASLVLAPLSRLHAQNRLTNTEKAAIITAVGACAAASAHAKEYDQGPAYRDPGKVVTVNIYNTSGERVPVYLYPRAGGWFGPRGEFYRTMPKVRYLSAVYGSRRPGAPPAAKPSAKPDPQPEAKKTQAAPKLPKQQQAQTKPQPPPQSPRPKHVAAAPGGPLKAEAGRGKLKILDGGKTVSTVRTSMPTIVDWKFADKQRQIIVKSRGKQGGAVVELFNTRTGTLQDKVMASEISKGRESWARGFED